LSSYRVDFIMNGSHEMLIDRVDGIYRQELDELELRMLHSVQAPYLLPMDWQELNGAVTFSYKLNGCKMLLHQLQQQRLTMDQYYGLLLNLTDALEDCRHHMLRPGGCLLNDEFLFTTDSELRAIRLTYMPMKEGSSDKGTNELLALIVRWTAYVEQLEGEGLKQILAVMNGKSWPLADLREVLMKLISPNAISSYSVAEGQLNTASQREEWRRIDNSEASSHLEWHNNATRSTEDRLEASNVTSLPEEAWSEADDGKRRWLTATLSVLLMACIWRFIYYESPTNTNLLISAALSLLIIAGMLLLWKKWAEGLAESVEARFANAEFVPDSGSFSASSQSEASPRQIQKQNDKGLQSMLAMNEAELLNAIFDTGGSKAAPLKSPHNSVRAASAANEALTAGPRQSAAEEAPARIMPSEPTVMLGKEQLTKGKQAEVWLTRSWQGREEKIRLEGEGLQIGRAEEKGGYIDLASGVSRLHLSFERCNVEKEDELSYVAKDLGSRNGSYLNGQPMIPYKSYKLTHNDTIHLASMEGSSYTISTSRPAS